jgi:hypothetical protein
MNGTIGIGSIGNFTIGLNVSPPPLPSGSVNVITNPDATLVAFAPTPGSPFQFQAVLDNQTYNVSCTWNIARGWYVSIYDQASTLIVSLPRIGSPVNYNISLTAGYFTTPMIFRVATQQFEIG